MIGSLYILISFCSAGPAYKTKGKGKNKGKGKHTEAKGKQPEQKPEQPCGSILGHLKAVQRHISSKGGGATPRCACQSQA